MKIILWGTLSTILINRNVTLAEGMAAIALPVFLQYAITWLSVVGPLQILEPHASLIALAGLTLFYGLERAPKVSREQRQARGQRGPAGAQDVLAARGIVRGLQRADGLSPGQ